jgi:5-methylcytosine-specific restriction protein A
MMEAAKERTIIRGYPKGPDGKPICRWCKAPVPKGRRMYCSSKCNDEYLIRNYSKSQRAFLWQRDKGICCQCGCDTEAIEEREQSFRRLRGFEIWDGRRHILRTPEEQRQAELDWSEYRAWMTRAGFSHAISLWQADHKIEVAAGGAELGLDNLQTLCTPCHKAKTARFAADRAAAKRRAKQPELAI